MVHLCIQHPQGSTCLHQKIIHSIKSHITQKYNWKTKLVIGCLLDGIFKPLRLYNASRKTLESAADPSHPGNT